MNSHYGTITNARERLPEFIVSCAAGPAGAGAYLESLAQSILLNTGIAVGKQTIFDVLTGKSGNTIVGGKPINVGIVSYNHWDIIDYPKIVNFKVKNGKLKIPLPNTHQFYVAIGKISVPGQPPEDKELRYFSSPLNTNGFTASDRLFAADGDQVYWQSGVELRRAVVRGGQIDINLRSKAFGPGDRLFAANGNTVWWQDNFGKLRRAEVKSDGRLDINLRCDEFNSDVDRLFAAQGDTVFWQAGNQLRSAKIVNSKLDVQTRWNGFDGKVDTLFAARGTTILWQAGNQLRRGRIENAEILIDLRYDKFDEKVDRLFSADEALQTVYWQAGNQLRSLSFGD